MSEIVFRATTGRRLRYISFSQFYVPLSQIMFLFVVLVTELFLPLLHTAAK
jgi:hypothetical protein